MPLQAVARSSVRTGIDFDSIAGSTMSGTDGTDSRDSKASVTIPPGVFLIAAIVAVTFCGIQLSSPEPPTAASISAESVTTPGESSASETNLDSPDAGDEAKANDDAEVAVSVEDERISKTLVGNWTQEFFGTRVLIVDVDGSGRMVILPSGLWAAAFGKRIDLKMFWSIKDGKIDYGYSEGTPADKVAIARKSWGDHWIEEILELNDTTLILLSEDGVTRSVWRRMNNDDEKLRATVMEQADSSK